MRAHAGSVGMILKGLGSGPDLYRDSTSPTLIDNLARRSEKRWSAHFVYSSTTLGLRPAAGSGASSGSSRRSEAFARSHDQVIHEPRCAFWMAVVCSVSPLSSLEKIISARVRRSPAFAGRSASSVFRSPSSTSCHGWLSLSSQASAQDMPRTISSSSSYSSASESPRSSSSSSRAGCTRGTVNLAPSWASPSSSSSSRSSISSSSSCWSLASSKIFLDVFGSRMTYVGP